jgi:hypothetical protein
MTGTEFNMHALGTSLVVLGLALLLSGLFFMLASKRKRSVSKEEQ